MERQSLAALFGSAGLMTLALLGMSVRWERFGDYIALLNDPGLTPLAFLPLLLVSIFGMMH